uniref:LOW QUALITY PROTEIN: basic helix-loop-helix domain-containing protein USF3-like n=1 Tax=Oncorhynchus gorbuscha TaxID=8017 RepID=UPI001EAE995A|nr:LOW QUALITY PROTEIN: basic helix-loop-helix domain-containing protein USF3-like [Oncorhynchus gorbuscha]
MPEMTENQTPGHKPRKKKNKESHNAVERQRKEKINAGINRIGDLLPCSQALKQSKNMILDQAYLYISELQKQNDAMLLEGGERVQVEEIRRLRRQLDELRRESGHYIELLKAHDINFLDDPTVHWKGKLRCAKVAKVTPTHQLPKGIIVYSNGNVICPAGKEPSPASDLGKQPVMAGIVQSSCDITAGVRVNVALQHVSVPSSAPPLLPKATLAPIVSTPGMKLVEQCVEEVPLAPKLPPSVSYITLQGICPLPMVTAALPRPTTQPLVSPLQPVWPPHSRSILSPALQPFPRSTTQNAAIGTMSYTTINSSPTVLRASAAGSTQTTWTTLQLAGNTVQPVCQSVGTKLSVQPIHIQMRPQVTIQPQAPITAHIQAQPSTQRTPQLRPAILAQHQPHCTVLPQSAIMSQPAVVANSTMISRPQPAVQQQATVPSHPQTVLMTQPQPAMLPQVQAQAHPQAAVRPLLQTMQVLQMNPTGTAIAGVTTPQNTNNPSVVILQQANPCSAQSVVSDDLTNQTPCQHIVIIQASNQPPPAPPQNPQVGMVPAAAPNQIVATSSTTSTTGQQIVGGKQLVHILPRPVPQTQTPQAPPVPSNPQTITVNGQVFALQPMKTSEKSGCKGGQSSLQLIQPSTAEEPSTAKEPTTNMHTLGALSSLNQSISQGMPSCISTQSNVQRTLASPSYSIVPQQKPSSVPILAAPHSSPVRQIQIPSVTPHRPGLAMGTGKALWRQPETASVPRPKRAITKRTKLVSKKEPKQGRPVTISAKPEALTGDRLEQEVTVPQGIPSSVAVTVRPKPLPVSTTANTPTVSSSEASTQTRPVEISINSTLSSPEGNSVTTNSYSGPTVSSECTTQSKTSVTSVTPCTAAISSSSMIFSSTQSELIITSVVSLATVTSAADKPTVTSTVSSQSKQPAVAVSDRSTHLRPTVTSTVSSQSKQPAVAVSDRSTHLRPTVTSTVSSQSKQPAVAVSDRSTHLRPTVTSTVSSQSKQPAVAVSDRSTHLRPTVTSTVSSQSKQPAVAVSDRSTHLRPTVTSTVSSQSKQPAVAVSDRSTHLRPTVTQNRQPVTTTISTVQTRSAITNGSSRQSRSTGACSTETRSRSTGMMSSAACQPSVSTVNSIGNRPVVSLQSAQLTSSSQGQTKPANSQESQPTTQTQFQPVASPSGPSTPTPCSGALSFASPSVTVPMTMPSEYRKWVPYNRPSTQQMTMPTSTPSHPAELNVTAVSGREKEPQAEGHPSAAMEKASARSDAAPSRMDYTLPQQVYVLDHEPLDQPPAPNRQTDSLMSGGAGGGRGFSVASMLPTGHSVSSSPGHFGSFTFASEQTDILAMLEQDSPGRRVGGCTVDNSSSANTPTPAWEPNSKSQQASNSKERSAGQQTKLTKQMETPVAKQVSVRVQAGDQTSAVRHPQNISFSQSHSHPQSQAQSGTSGTLSVNNLIRPSSSQQQAYPGSLSLAGQLGSVPSPAGNSAHVSQTSTPVLPPFSGSVQLNEYAPLMRPQVGVGEPRYIKDLSKRPAQEDVILSSSTKRQKTCSSASNVGRMEVKPLDHSQMMVPQLPPTTSSIMTRINPDGVGTLFSGNTFMSTMLRPTESHCTPQLPTQEHNQPGVLHLPHGHPQHGASQPGQHLGGNPYLKQQQQQQQQEHQGHHLYQLQHHLTQPDPAHLHSLHQRALQQVQKKRGLVGGGQKQHHQEKGGVQQHQHQQSQQSHQQQPQTHQQHQQQSQQHQQQSQQQHQQQTQQQHQPQALSQQQHLQQHPQQQHQQQSSHSRHQHLQQQQIQHFGSQHQEKSCEAQPGPAGPRGHHSSHPAQEHLKSDQDHSTMQRLMSSRNLEQHLTSQPSNPASQPSDLGCAPPRQDHHRVSSYSAEALIGKGSSSDEQQRMVLHLQATRGTTQEQPDLRGYLDTPRVKGNVTHNPQSRLPPDHPGSADVQRVSECPPFKTMASAEGGHQLGGFEDMTPKSGSSSQRGQQGGFRMNPGPPGDGRTRGGYSGPHPGTQGVQIGAPGLTRDQEGCHQSFMQSLLEQTDHQRAVQCCPPVSMEYGCVPGSSAGDMQAKASSPSVPPTQKASAMRLGEGNKGHIPHGSGNMGTHPGVRTGLPHPLTPHNSSEPGRTTASSRPPTAVSQRSRHITQEAQSGKLRPGERPRSGSLRPGNPFEPDVHLLGRPQSGSEARRSSIVRFMADSAQASGDNNLVPDQHLAQNFGFSFMPDGGLNLPPINANSTFIPPVSQTNSSRPSSLLPVEPQNTLPSFYPSYPPAAHPSLASDIPIQYFSNQMFTSPGADKSSSAPLNNRFGSILSPPRSVGFAQATFPLLSDMPAMPISNSSGITPHLSNFSLTSLFPEIATAMQPDGSAMPMSPLLSLSNNSSADSGKQPNRLAHNISHILGHDGSSAV